VHPPEPSPTGADVASFDEVYRREGVKMVRLAVLLVGSQQYAKEIVQDAFAQLFERWVGIERPGAYLRTCVINGCRRARGRWRREHAQGRPSEQAAAPEGDTWRTR
jgi:DNA-directed RNA polymerase specialized sigma24 family protein